MWCCMRRERERKKKHSVLKCREQTAHSALTKQIHKKNQGKQIQKKAINDLQNTIISKHVSFYDNLKLATTEPQAYLHENGVQVCAASKTTFSCPPD